MKVSSSLELLVCGYQLLGFERVSCRQDVLRIKFSLGEKRTVASSLFPSMKVQSDLSASQEPVEIKTNPFFYLSTRLKVFGERDDDILHQLKFAWRITRELGRSRGWRNKFPRTPE